MIKLERMCAGLATKVQFLGRVPPAAIPRVLSEHEVLLAPSRYEGLPLVLIEAMAAGCVPVATRLRGVTDYIVTHGADGLLFEMGAVKEAARLIQGLHNDRNTLARLSSAGPVSTQRRFSVAEMAAGYRRLLDSLPATTVRPPLPLSEWKYPHGLRGGLRTYLPLGIKNELRRLRERFPLLR
jgi:glycosyltransferase involved in cell wall biosynthesis